MTEDRILNIYVTGPGKRNADTISNCKAACASWPNGGSVSLRVIDILKNPKAAEKDKILATPTLILQSLDSDRRVIGEFKNEKVAHQAICFLTSEATNKKNYGKSKKGSS